MRFRFEDAGSGSVHLCLFFFIFVTSKKIWNWWNDHSSAAVPTGPVTFALAPHTARTSNPANHHQRPKPLCRRETLKRSASATFGTFGRKRFSLFVSSFACFLRFFDRAQNSAGKLLQVDLPSPPPHVAPALIPGTRFVVDIRGPSVPLRYPSLCPL